MPFHRFMVSSQKLQRPIGAVKERGLCRVKTVFTIEKLNNTVHMNVKGKMLVKRIQERFSAKGILQDHELRSNLEALPPFCIPNGGIVADQQLLHVLHQAALQVSRS